jgi:hypothetical protein
MVRGLETNPRVRLIDVRFHKPSAASLIKTARDHAGGSLPDGMDAFYQCMSGFQLEWRENAEHGQVARGMIDILPLHRVLSDWRGTLWSPGTGGEEPYKSVKPVDFFVEEACAALIQPEAGQALRDEIVYHYLGESIEHTGHSFKEWIAKLLAARGYFYWIRALCAGSQESPEVQAFRQKMPLIFEDYDDSLFQPKTR